MKISLNRIFIFSLICLMSAAISASGQTKPKTAVKKPVVKTSAPTNYSPSPIETEVLTEINQARNNPAQFIGYLDEYKKNMKGTILSLPNRQKIQTIEGTAAIDDAVSALKAMQRVENYAISEGLSRVARTQLNDLLENPNLSHKGKDGSTLDVRLMRVGFPGNAYAENISYHADIAREVILNMLIDDGFKSRSHRKNIYSQTFKYIGIACGAGADKKNICVLEFADSFKMK